MHLNEEDALLKSTHPLVPRRSPPEKAELVLCQRLSPINNMSSIETDSSFVRSLEVHYTTKCRKCHSTVETRFRKAISVEQRMTIAIWHLATNAEYRTIGHLFGVSRSSVCGIVYEVCAAIVRQLMYCFIRLPTGDKLEEIVAGFREVGFPHCAGAVDGTNIPIIAPAEYHADYHNRKGWYSILMQAVVDHQYRFTDVCIGWPRLVHDARVFANSKVFRRVEEDELFPNQTVVIKGIQMPIVLFGYPAYPLMPWLMKPFSDNGRLTREQHIQLLLKRLGASAKPPQGGGLV